MRCGRAFVFPSYRVYSLFVTSTSLAVQPDFLIIQDVFNARGGLKLTIMIINIMKPNILKKTQSLNADIHTNTLQHPIQKNANTAPRGTNSKA